MAANTAAPNLLEADAARPEPTGGAYGRWSQAYTLPHVGLNHPARWQWDSSAQTVEFNAPDSSSTTPQDLPFYQMKGFFITPFQDAVNGPNLSMARAGDQLRLTTRVYNFSPVDTDDPNLRTPAKTIWVSIFGQEPVNGVATVDSVSLPVPTPLLNQRVKILANVTTTAAAASPVKLAYYDGDPNKGGVLFGYQQLPYIAPFSNYLARNYYQPSSCGEHSLYVVASTPGATPTTSFTTTRVTIDPASAIQDLSSSVTSANLPAGLTRRLKWLLTIANYFFSQQDNRAGVLALRFFDQLVKSESGKAIEQQEADSMIGQVREMTLCLRTVNAHAIAPALTTLLSEAELQSLIQRSHLQKP